MIQHKAVEQVRPAILMMTWKEMVKLVIAGAVIGLVGLMLFAVFDTYVFTPSLCSDLNAGTGRCENKLYYASSVAMIISGIGALFFMVQQRVYRPLLVVLLTTVALWNVLVMMDVLPLWARVLMAMVIFALAYGAFAWLVQIRNFLIALSASIVLVIAIRLLLIS